MIGLRSNKVIFSLDDFYDGYKNNAMNYLWYLKSLYPKFKVTLFTIPNRLSESGINLMKRNADWIEYAIHGWDHDQNEVDSWDEKRCREVLDKCESLNIFTKGFKAPNWVSTDIMRRVLLERGYWSAEHHRDHEHAVGFFSGLRIHCLCNRFAIHGHTWDLNNPDPSFNNGIRQLIEEQGMQFDDKTDFKFISELWTK
jgi:hypothetical protein